MIIGPRRREGESLSSYRFRYAKGCGLVAAGFFPFLFLLYWAKPDPSVAPGPIFFLYIGIPIGLGMAVVGGLGLLFGSFWSLAVSESKRAKVRVVLSAVFVFSVSIFAAYKGIAGLFTGVTLFAWFGGPTYVHRLEMPLHYWYSEVFWLWCSFYFPYFMLGIIRKAFDTSGDAD